MRLVMLCGKNNKLSAEDRDFILMEAGTVCWDLVIYLPSAKA
jgi:hypothetical protein